MCGRTEPVICPAICVRDVCQCKRGFARDLNGSCVRDEDCPPRGNIRHRLAMAKKLQRPVKRTNFGFFFFFGGGVFAKLDRHFRVQTVFCNCVPTIWELSLKCGLLYMFFQGGIFFWGGGFRGRVSNEN